jgi:hypothetical protein
LCMRRQYKINHRTRNNRFDSQELIARLEDNRVSTILTKLPRKYCYYQIFLGNTVLFLKKRVIHSQ